MTIFEELESKIRLRGVRVQERLALLAILKTGDGSAQLSQRVQESQAAIEEAARSVRQEIR